MIHTGFQLSDDEQDIKQLQDIVCSASIVRVVAYEGEYPPPYVAHVYLKSDLDPPLVWAGTVWRDDRLPTIDEITAVLTQWRGAGSPIFNVEWYKEIM